MRSCGTRRRELFPGIAEAGWQRGTSELASSNRAWAATANELILRTLAELARRREPRPVRGYGTTQRRSAVMEDGKRYERVKAAGESAEVILRACDHVRRGHDCSVLRRLLRSRRNVVVLLAADWMGHSRSRCMPSKPTGVAGRSGRSSSSWRRMKRRIRSRTD